MQIIHLIILQGDVQVAERYYENVLQNEPHNSIALKNLKKLQNIRKQN